MGNLNKKQTVEEIKKNLNKEFTSADLPNIKHNNKDFQEKMNNFYNSLTKSEFSKEDFLDKNDNVKVESLNSPLFKIKTPDYLQNVYTWAYLNPKNVKLLDRNIVVHILLFLNASRLIKSYLSEVPKGSIMLQLAHVYGNMIPKLAAKIGSTGHLDLIDVAPVQLAHAYKKLKHFEHVDLWQQDATVAYHRDYDIVGSFFLLHEVPLKAKIAIVNNMLQQVEKNNAKAVFIDYHQPSMFHPLKPLMRLVNIFLEPFANEMWEYDIKTLSSNPDKFNWEKKTFFGKMYQKVVVTKK